MREGAAASVRIGADDLSALGITRRTFESLAGEFKQVATGFLALRQESIALEQSHDNVREWRTAFDRRYDEGRAGAVRPGPHDRGVPRPPRPGFGDLAPGDIPLCPRFPPPPPILDPPPFHHRSPDGDSRYPQRIGEEQLSARWPPMPACSLPASPSPSKASSSRSRVIFLCLGGMESGRATGLRCRA